MTEMNQINQMRGSRRSVLDEVFALVSNRLRFKILQALLAVHILVVACPFVWNLFSRIFNPPPKKLINVRLITQLPDAPSEFSSSAKGGAPPPPRVIPTRPQPRVRPQPIKPPPIKPVKAPTIKPVKRQTPIKKQPVVKPKTKPQPPSPPRPQPKLQPPSPPSRPQPKLQPITDSQWQEMNRPKTPPENRNVSRTEPQGKPGDNQEGEKFRLDYIQFIGKYLKEEWNTKNILPRGVDKTEVKVRIWLSPTGAITQWQLLKSSGFTAVDISVINLFREVRELPQPPPKGLSDITFSMKIKD